MEISQWVRELKMERKQKGIFLQNIFSLRFLIITEQREEWTQFLSQVYL